MPKAPCTCPLSSVVPEQQARAHDDPEPPHPPDGGRVRLHRLHPHHAVRGRGRHPPHRPVGGDSHLAPPGWQMANRPLPQIRRALCPTAVSPVRLRGWGRAGREGTLRAPQRLGSCPEHPQRGGASPIAVRCSAGGMGEANSLSLCLCSAAEARSCPCRVCH